MLKFALFCEHCLSLLFIHCSCMLIEERSVHVLILIKPNHGRFVRVNSLTFVTDDCLCRVADIYDMVGWINWCWKWIDDRGIQMSRILAVVSCRPYMENITKLLDKNISQLRYPRGGETLTLIQAGVLGPSFRSF